MKCRLCGQSPAGSAGLCGNCTKALTRAREGSAALRKGPPTVAGGKRRVNRINLTMPVSPDPAAAPPSGRWRLVLWGSLILGVIAIVAVGVGGATFNRAHSASAVDRAPRITAALPSGGEADLEAADAELTSTSIYANNPNAILPSAPRSESVPVPARTHATGSPANSRSGVGAEGSTRTAVNDARPGYPSGPAAADSDRPAQMAQASVPQTTVTRDDGQALATALEKCADEKFLAGVICEQKARLRYCDGKWGQVPQCTARPRAD